MRRRVLRVSAALAAAALTACAGPAAPRSATPVPAPTITSTALATPPATRPATPPTPPPTAPPLAQPLPGAPPEFYGVIGSGLFRTPAGGRIAAFDSATGKRLRLLTTPPPGWTDGSPSVVERSGGRQIVFVREPRGRHCGRARILAVPAGGGPATPVVRLPRVSLRSFAVDRAGTALAYAYDPCTGDDPRGRITVVALPGGRTVATARSTFLGNGIISVGALGLHGRRLLVGMGIHLQYWVAVLDVRDGARDVDLDRLPELPLPSEQCRPNPGVWTVRAGAPALRGSVMCPRGADAHFEHRPATWWGPSLRQAEYGPFGKPPELTGSDGRGYLIGTRGVVAQGMTYRIVQVSGDRERRLGLCRGADFVSDACALSPVW